MVFHEILDVVFEGPGLEDQVQVLRIDLDLGLPRRFLLGQLVVPKGQPGKGPYSLIMENCLKGIFISFESSWK